MAFTTGVRGRTEKGTIFLLDKSYTSCVNVWVFVPVVTDLICDQRAVSLWLLLCLTYSDLFKCVCEYVFSVSKVN